MICTPIGSVSWQPQTGTAQTGRPMNEIGCVSRPRLGRAGRRRPLISIHSVPIAGATHGVAGAIRTSTSRNSSAARSANQRRSRCAWSSHAAGNSAPARKRSRDSGSKSRGARAQVAQMQQRALGVGDQERGGAGPLDLRQVHAFGATPSDCATRATAARATASA